MMHYNQGRLPHTFIVPSKADLTPPDLPPLNPHTVAHLLVEQPPVIGPLWELKPTLHSDQGPILRETEWAGS